VPEPKHRLYLLVHSLQQLHPVMWLDSSAAVAVDTAAPERVVWSSVTAPTHVVRARMDTHGQLQDAIDSCDSRGRLGRQRGGFGKPPPRKQTQGCSKIGY
jgi:hypothetical protein